MASNSGKAKVFRYMDGKLSLKYTEALTIEIEWSLLELQLSAKIGFQTVFCCKICKETECAQAGKQSFMINTGEESLLLKFESDTDMKRIAEMVKALKAGDRPSVFHERTEESSAVQYFQFYAYLSQQQNMMQDFVRTSTYQRAILSNPEDFHDKVVLDVGAGSGILSFFAVQAGARKVYAVEASSMVEHCSKLIKSNHLDGRIECVYGKIEEIQLPEKVDMIISEPMGYMLYNERMLESYLHAKKWLKPGGRMFPTTGDLFIAPFSDYQLHMEQYQKANFWCQNSFHGVDLTCLRDEAVSEGFRQPIVDTFHMDTCMAPAVQHPIDFEQVDEAELHLLDIPLQFTMSKTGHVHGLAFWFDVTFKGSKETVVLSTAPTEALTHWYQVRCLLPTPVFVEMGATLHGSCILRANTRQSYDVELSIQVPGGDTVSTNTLDLKNPFFRYSGQAPVPEPGNHTGDASPTDLYWSNDAVPVADTLNDIVMLQQQQQVAAVSQQLGAVSLEYQSAAVSKVLPMAGPPGSQSAPIHPGCIPAVGTVTSLQPAQQTLFGGHMTTSSANTFQFNG